MGYKWRPTLHRLDCRPKSFQLSKKSFPKNTTQCNFFCPYYLICQNNSRKKYQISYPQKKVLTKNLKIL